VGKLSRTSPRASGGGARQTVGRPHGGWGLEARRRGLFVSCRPPDSSGPAAGRGQEHVDAPSPLFADSQEEQQLWEELRGHGASLNRALNEALQIHGGPAWHVFRVRCRCFFPCSVVFVFVSRRLSVFVCWQHELELRTRDRYGALD
jgi:hypothetical protein